MRIRIRGKDICVITRFWHLTSSALITITNTSQGILSEYQSSQVSLKTLDDKYRGKSAITGRELARHLTLGALVTNTSQGINVRKDKSKPGNVKRRH